MQTTMTHPTRSRLSDHLFGPVLLLVMAGAVVMGLRMRKVTVVPVGARAVQGAYRARIMIMAPKPPEQPAKTVAKPFAVAKTMPAEPVDLTREPSPAEAEQTREPPTDKPVRRVYGLRKVYARGIGAGGTMADAVVGKLGNTLSKEFDTLSATREEIKGTIVSTTTITTPPRFRKQVKPEYTSDMLDNRVEGTVKVKALVDIDGRVKMAAILADIGFDSAAQAIKATLSMEFDPARRGTDAVAVWIVIPIRFVLLS